MLYFIIIDFIRDFDNRVTKYFTKMKLQKNKCTGGTL